MREGDLVRPHRRPLQLTAAPGNRITPSYVAFTDEERLVGDAAKNQAAANPFRTIFDIKRLIGRKFSEKEVQNDIKHFPYKVVSKDDKPVVKVEVGGSEKTFTPEEISAMVLSKVRPSLHCYAPSLRPKTPINNPTDEGDRRVLPWQEGHPRRCHSTGLLQ